MSIRVVITQNNINGSPLLIVDATLNETADSQQFTFAIEPVGPLYSCVIEHACAVKPTTSAEPIEFGLYECVQLMCKWHYMKYDYNNTSLWTTAAFDDHLPRHLLTWEEFTQQYGDCVSNLRKIA